MKFDKVLDVQQAYRSILHAFSYPGEIVSLKSALAHMDKVLPCLSATQILLYMLLDTDTSVHVVSQDHQLRENLIQVTNCVEKPIEQAQYVVVSKEAQNCLGDIIRHVSLGTLEHPHEGATILVECNSVQKRAMYELKGPGIKDTNTISISQGCEWISARADVNIEFPLGVDMIFVDDQGNCVAIPRTIQIARVK